MTSLKHRRRTGAVVYADEELIGSARTDGDGVAALKTPPMIATPTAWGMPFRSLTVATAIIASLLVAHPIEAGPLDCLVDGVDDHCEEWSRAYDDPSARGGSEGQTGRNDATSVLVAPTGDRVFLVGEIRTDSNQNLTRVWAVDPASGDEQWVATYGGPGGNNFSTNDAVLSMDGSRLFVTGSSRADLTISDSDATTVAFDTATGERLWVAPFDGPGDPSVVDMDSGTSVRPSPDDEHVYVTVSSQAGPPTGNDIQTLAYDASTGEVVWSTRYASPDLQQPAALAVTPDGKRVVVVGSGEGDGTTGGAADKWDYDWVVIAYETGQADATQGGEEAWRARFDAPEQGHSYDGATDVVMDPHGEHVFVVGQSGDTGTRADFTTLALDLETGAVQWEARYRPDGSAGLGYTSMPSVAIDAEGTRLFLTGRGQREANGYNWDMVTAAFDAATGRLMWADSYDHLGNIEAGRTISVAPDGEEVFVSGWYDTFITVAYDAGAGVRRWTARFDSSPNDVRAGVVASGNTDSVSANAISPDGTRLFVAGEFSYQEPVSSQAQSGNNSDAGLVAYDLERLPSPNPSETSSPTPSASITATPSSSGSASPSPTESPTGPTEVSFTDSNSTAGQFSDKSTFEAKLIDSDGEPINGAQVVFELTGAESSRSFTATTNGNGFASVIPTLEERPGPYQLTVRFAGDDNYDASSDMTSFVVEKEDSVLEFTVEGNGKNRTLMVRLADADTPDYGVADRTIDFYGDGDYLGSATTDEDGVAILKAPPGYRGGKHEFRARFAGDDYYLASFNGERT